MKDSRVEEFDYKLESDAILDIFSTAGEEEVNQDNFEVLSNKNLTILILADGEGKGVMGEILSELASSRALTILDEYQFDKKSSEEIVSFLEALILEVNDSIVEYLETANIQDSSTALSIAVIYKNSLYTAHIGESRIYVIHRDETATLLSKDPSYTKRISKKSMTMQDSSYFLGDKSLSKEQIFVKHEANLHHKDRVVLCSKHILDVLLESRFSSSIEEIKSLLETNPPLKNSTLLRYLHYERSVKVLRVEKEDIEETKLEIDWEKTMPIIKKVALALGIIIILGVFYLFLANDSEDVSIDEGNSASIEKSLKPREVNKTIQPHPILPPLQKSQPVTVKPDREEPIAVAREELNTDVIASPFEKKTPRVVAPPKVSIEDNSLRVLTKADSDVLYLGEDGIRITFKENKLVASQVGLIQERDGNPNELYCILDGVKSKLHGDISNKLTKQYYSNGVTITNHDNRVIINISIKKSCSYTRSKWAKKSGLDLLTFGCE